MLERGSLARLAVLSLTNLPILTPATWAMGQGLAAEGALLAAVAFASTLYHACDEGWWPENDRWTCSPGSFRIARALDESIARTSAVVGAALLGGAPRRLRLLAVMACLAGCACLQASPGGGSDSSLVLATSIAVLAGVGGLVYSVAREVLRFAVGARALVAAAGQRESASRAARRWWRRLGQVPEAESDDLGVLPPWEVLPAQPAAGPQQEGVPAAASGPHRRSHREHVWDGAECCFVSEPAADSRHD